MSRRALKTSPQAPLAARTERLAEFAATALDWEAVRALFVPFARSDLGRRALAELVPLADAEAREAIARLGELEAAPDSVGEPPLAGLCDAPALVADAGEQGRAMDGEALVAIAGFLRCEEALRLWLSERRVTLPACARLGVRLVDLSDLRAELDAGLEPNGEPRDEASLQLARLRLQSRRIARELEQQLKDLARRPNARSALADGQVGHVHQRHGRLVLAIKATHLGQVPGAVLDHSASGETLFVEPREYADLGNHLVELRADEARESSRLFVQWTRAVLARRGGIDSAAHAMAQLEIACIGRDMARAFGGRAPLLPGDRDAAQGLLLRAAHHPLLAAQQRAGRILTSVPLDLRLGDTFDQLLITGPNTGGKTLALKTAGVCVLLARAGLPILADSGSTVPLYRGIVADIGDEQEVEQSLSTFASHMARIAAGLRRATPDVLFLLDEVGGATDPEEGAVLGEVLLERLLARRVPTLATTHLARLVEYAWRHARVENASVEFDPISLAPTYRLLVGTPGSSQALNIARRLGLPADLVAEAERRRVRPDGHVALLIAELGEARRAAEQARVAADAQLADLARREREQSASEAEFAQRRAQLMGDVDGELERRLALCRPALARVRALLPQLPTAQRHAIEEPLAALAAAVEAASLSERRQAYFARLSKGDPVWLPRYGRRCPVVRIDRERRVLRVRLGQRDLEVDFDDAAAFEAL